MAQKLWEKSVQVDRDVERFTVGKDREMDLYLAPFDRVAYRRGTETAHRRVTEHLSGYRNR